MILDIIVNNPGWYEYMSNSKDTAPVHLIYLREKHTQNKDIVFYVYHDYFPNF